DSLRFPRIPDGLAAEPDDPREPRGAQGSGLAADLRAERPEPGVRRSPDPVGSGPHLDRSGRRGPRPLLPRPRRPGHRSADGGRGIPHVRRPREPYGRVGRADLDDLSRPDHLRDAAADSGAGRASRLNLLEGLRLADHRPHSVEHLHMLVEISKLAYADRDRWIGDPAHAKVPVAGLLSKPYAAGRRAEFDPSKAQSYPFGDPRGDTTGFVVADERGNLISVIQSLFNAFGSGVVPPGTGVVLQNRGRHFTTDPAHPAALAPGKRPFHTLMACVATRDARPVLGFATMGGNGQAMFHLQVLTNLFDYGMDIQEA